MMEATRPLISVIIPHLNQHNRLRNCLESLSAQTLACDNFEVIVADNGSYEFPGVNFETLSVRVVQELEPGPGAARNRGVAEAKGDLLAFIDADCVAHRDSLKNALQAMEAAPENSVLGGDVRIWRDDPTAFSALEAYESVFAYRFQMYIEEQGFCGTGNLFVKRNDFLRVGKFKGIDFAEDMDWGRRATAAGMTIRYVPEMIVYHPARKTLKELFVKWDRQLQHYANMARGRRGWRLAWFARAVAVLASPAADWTKVMLSDRIHGAGARMKALAILIAIRTYRFVKMMRLLSSRGEVVWNRAALPQSKRR
jgi:GT2 family glycosyltransferase